MMTKKKYDELLKEHTNAKGGVNTKFTKQAVVEQLRVMYKRVLYKK